ncbi:MAG: hypothetical protein ACK4K6_16295 [Pseudarthrobacter sp.]
MGLDVRTAAYAPVQVWVTFYDPVPAVPASPAQPAQYATLDSADDWSLVDAVRRFNGLLSSVRATMLAPPVSASVRAVDLRTACWDLELEFSDPDGGTVDQMSYVIGEGLPISVRFQYQEDTDRNVLPVTISAVITGREIHLSSMDGMTLTVRAISSQVAEARKRPRPPPVPLNRGASVERAMGDLLDAVKWPSLFRVIQGGATLTRPLTYTPDTDLFQFIRDAVVPSLNVASSERNTGESYQLYMDGDILHFHQPAWRGNPDNAINRMGSLVELVVRQPDGPVLDLRVRSEMFTAMTAGIANSIETSWNLLSGTPDAAETTVADRGTTVPTAADALVPSLPTLPYLPIRANSVEERDAKARLYYERLKRGVINIALVLKGRPDLKFLDQFRLTYLRSDGTPHYISGIYSILSLMHTINDQGWTTHVEAYRLSFGEADTATASALGLRPKVRNDVPAASEDAHPLPAATEIRRGGLLR